MPSYTCPVCETTADPAAQVRTVAVCGHCGASLTIAPDGTASRATAVDTLALTEPERQTLRKARGRTR